MKAVRVHCIDGAWDTDATIYGIWAATRHVDLPQSWKVTHIPTGRSLPDMPRAGRMTALRIAKAVNAEFPTLLARAKFGLARLPRIPVATQKRIKAIVAAHLPA